MLSLGRRYHNANRAAELRHMAHSRPMGPRAEHEDIVAGAHAAFTQTALVRQRNKVGQRGCCGSEGGRNTMEASARGRERIRSWRHPRHTETHRRADATVVESRCG